jgi:hypothetical protein
MYASKSVFPQNFYQAGTHQTIFYFPKHLCKRLQTSRKETVDNAHRLFPYCQITDNFPDIFRVVFGILRGVLRFLRTYCTNSRRTPNGNPTNPRLETLLSIDGIYE